MPDSSDPATPRAPAPRAAGSPFGPPFLPTRFREDPHFIDDLYLNNFSTQGLAPGSYVIRGVLDDGTTHDVAIRLK